MMMLSDEGSNVNSLVEGTAFDPATPRHPFIRPCSQRYALLPPYFQCVPSSPNHISRVYCLKNTAPCCRLRPDGCVTEENFNTAPDVLTVQPGRQTVERQSNNEPELMNEKKKT